MKGRTDHIDFDKQDYNLNSCQVFLTIHPLKISILIFLTLNLRGKKKTLNRKTHLYMTKSNSTLEHSCF